MKHLTIVLAILALVACRGPVGPKVAPTIERPAPVEHPGEQLSHSAAPTAVGPTVEPDASRLMVDPPEDPPPEEEPPEEEPPDDTPEESDPETPPRRLPPHCPYHPHDPPRHTWHQHPYHGPTEGHMHTVGYGGSDECKPD